MAVTFLKIDSEPSALNTYQLLKTITVVQTAIIAGRVTANVVHVVTTDLELIDVSTFGAIRVQCWGEGDSNDVPVIDLYGWPQSGPGTHIGKITTSMGAFTSPADNSVNSFHSANRGAHKSISDEFALATAYRGCDVYTETNDYEGAITVYTGEADFPSFFDVSFANNQYNWFGILVTDLGTPAATNLGAIFRVLSIKEGYSSPQFT